MKKILCIIHTTQVTVNSLKPLTMDLLKDTTVYNFLDDSILPEINAAGEITSNVKDRFLNMVRSCKNLNPNAILIACSSIGGLKKLAQNIVDIPVIRIDEPMAKSAVEEGKIIGVCATLKSTLMPTKELLYEINKDVIIKELLIENVNDLLSQGKEDEYDAKVSSKIIDLKKEVDIVLLAQASMARVLYKVKEDKEKYKSSPLMGIKYVKALLEDE